MTRSHLVTLMARSGCRPRLLCFGPCTKKLIPLNERLIASCQTNHQMSAPTPYPQRTADHQSDYTAVRWGKCLYIRTSVLRMVMWSFNEVTCVWCRRALAGGVQAPPAARAEPRGGRGRRRRRRQGGAHCGGSDGGSGRRSGQRHRQPAEGSAARSRRRRRGWSLERRCGSQRCVAQPTAAERGRGRQPRRERQRRRGRGSQQRWRRRGRRRWRRRRRRGKQAFARASTGGRRRRPGRHRGSRHRRACLRLSAGSNIGWGGVHRISCTSETVMHIGNPPSNIELNDIV